MLNFVNDYSEGCMPEILTRLQEINLEKNTGYGLDDYCEQAKRRIQDLCDCPRAQVYFLAGGTQSNQVVIASLLDSFDGVVSTDCGHVNVHEAGAIEYTGHKVLTLPHHEGKMDAGELRRFLEDYYQDGNYEHMVRPGMVYLSHPTEIGTIYSRKELAEINSVCREYEIPLYLDGARLACALTAGENDVTWKDLAELTDVFYIGGTKCGALYGEAVVFTKENMPFRFHTRVKQQGAMLAKGWIPGLQFDTLLGQIESDTGNISTFYEQGGAHANEMAERIKETLRQKGYRFYVNSPTNQIFLIADKEQLKKWDGKVQYSFFEKYDEQNTVIRFATSWATKESDVDALLMLL